MRLYFLVTYAEPAGAGTNIPLLDLVPHLAPLGVTAAEFDRIADMSVGASLDTETYGVTRSA